ncbi:LysR substrate-binding domain-containing protein [Aestuariivirga sp.]|uniref:LysR substrate-binding domain-containing protein n=1 Tax=Aestuariivirga sp. TaxID=2650926 RepID=UPI003BAC3E4D
MLRYTLRQIEYAVTIWDRGSVAAASAQLGVAQPTLSASLAKLEEQIGLQLFIRHHAQGVSPSPAGLRFLAEARNLLTHAQDLQRDMLAAGTAIEGQLALGSFTTIAPSFVPQLIKSFTSVHPKVTIAMAEGTQDELFDGLRGGAHDLALLYDVDMPQDFAVTTLASFEPHVLLPAGHRLTRLKQVPLIALKDEPFVLLDIAPSRTYFTRLLETAGIVPRIAFSSPSLEVVRGLVGQGLGYSILVTRPHGDHSYSGDALAVRPIADDVERGVIALAGLKQMRKTRLVSAFETHCEQYFRTLAS